MYEIIYEYGPSRGVITHTHTHTSAIKKTSYSVSPWAGHCKGKRQEWDADLFEF